MCNFLHKVKFTRLGHVYKVAQIYKVCYNTFGSRFYKNMESPNFHKGKQMEIKKCKECNDEINFGKHTGERRFWGSEWEMYECNGITFRPDHNWSAIEYTCGKCNTNTDKGLGVGESIR